MKKKKQKKLKLNRIRWRDANTVSGWQRMASIAPASILVDSVGWLVSENDDAVLLAMSVTHGDAAELLSIPVECIVDRWQL